MNKYVLGFMFSKNLEQVALIHKLNPKWQRGKLNGIGGKIEKDETSITAMIREFTEETGYGTNPLQWQYYAELKGENEDGGSCFHVDVFTTTGDLSLLKSMEKELVQIINIEDVRLIQKAMIENLPFLLALAIDSLTDGRPEFTTIRY